MKKEMKKDMKEIKDYIDLFGNRNSKIKATANLLTLSIDKLNLHESRFNLNVKQREMFNSIMELYDDKDLPMYYFIRYWIDDGEYKYLGLTAKQEAEVVSEVFKKISETL